MSNPITQMRAMRPVEVPRCTFQFNMYHGLPGEDPKQVTLGGDKLLTVNENWYDRTITVDEPIVLDFGYLSAELLGTIILYNQTGVGRRVQPTEEELAEDESAIVHLQEFPGLIVAPRSPPTILHLDDSFKQLIVFSEDAPARLRFIGVPR